MNNPDPVAASLAAAAAAAASAPAGHYVPPVSGQVPGVFTPQAGAVINAGPKGHKLAVTSMKGGSGNALNVDNFLGVKPHGIIINFPNDDPRKATLGQIALQPLILLVDYATDVTPKYSVRAGVGNAIKFFHSFDRITLDDGVTPWDQVVAKCRQGDPKCKGDYPSIDIAGVLLNPAVLITGQEVLPAGKRVGFSTSVMNWQEYQMLHAQLVAADMVAEYDDNTMEGKVVLKMFGIIKTNKGGIQYGAYQFEALGKGDDVVVPGAPAQAPVAAPAMAAAAQPTAPNPSQVNTGAYVQPGAGAAPAAQYPGAAAATPASPTQPGIIPGVAAADVGVSGKPRRSRKAAEEAAA